MKDKKRKSSSLALNRIRTKTIITISDIDGPMSTTSRIGYKYFIIFHNNNNNNHLKIYLLPIYNLLLK
jgi:hypothetical protein